jgi:hypothetical protein
MENILRCESGNLAVSNRILFDARNHNVPENQTCVNGNNAGSGGIEECLRSVIDESINSIANSDKSALHCCFFCGFTASQLQQHWFSQHAEAAAVRAVLLATEPTRNELIAKLTNLGDECHKLNEVLKQNNNTETDRVFHGTSSEIVRAESTKEHPIETNRYTNCNSDDVTALHSDQPEPNSLDIESFDNELIKISIVCGESYCYFCGSLQAHIKRHWFSVHQYEPEVMELSRLKIAGDRMKHMIKLKNLGNHKHNMKVISDKKGKLLVKSMSKRQVSYKDFATCGKCFCYLPKEELDQHNGECQEVEKDNKNDETLNASFRLSKSFGTSAKIEALLFDVGEGGVKSITRTDSLIRRYAEDLIARRGMTHKYEIRQEVCDLARFLMEVRKHSGMAVSMVDCIKPQRFKTCVLAVKSLAGFDTKTKTFARSSLAMRLGRALRHLADVVRKNAMKCGDGESMKSAECFIQLCASEWSDETLALSDEENPVRNHSKPQTSDLKVRNNSLNQSATDVRLRGSEAGTELVASSRKQVCMKHFELLLIPGTDCLVSVADV